MNRRIVAGMVLVAALLPGCFLFASDAEAPASSDGGSGGSVVGGGGGGSPSVMPPQREAAFLETDGGADGVPLPLDGDFALEQGRVDSGFTLSVWVRPLKRSEGGKACPEEREPPAYCQPDDVTFDLALCEADAPDCVPGNPRFVRCLRNNPGCVPEDPDADVCGTIAAFENDRGEPLVGLRLDGRCVVPFADGAVTGPNVSRWAAPAGAWTHVALRAFQTGTAWSIDHAVNGETAGDSPWPNGPLYFGDRVLRVGAGLTAQLDEVRLRRDKLTDNNFRRDMREEPLTGPLVAWWSFDELGDGPVTELRDRAAFDNRLDATGLVLRPGGLSRDLPSGPDPACVDPRGGAPLDEAGDLVACRRDISANEPALESEENGPLCGTGFHLCGMDDAPLRAFVAGPTGPEGVAGCFAIGALRAATVGHDPGGKFDELIRTAAERTCSDTCSFPADDPICAPTGCTIELAGGDPDKHFEPERLAIGVACDVDRPMIPHASCRAGGLPGIRSPEDIALNDCAQRQFVVDGVACCRD